ncbi:hypothetical protein [Geodermatophilus sp. FMUSA9-8]|uniref:hypothetical protein n=1 Tax=Geodermatophilus sp. FMUSA9-8 TaxID=3120155 RepID=UPI003009BF20
MKGLAVYVGLAEHTESVLAAGLREFARAHAAEGELPATAELLAGWSEEHVRRLAPVRSRYGDEPDSEPDQLRAAGMGAARTGPVGLLRDLQDLYTLAALTDTTWTVLLQAGLGARDRELQGVARSCQDETSRQLAWLVTHLKQVAPQALLAAS